MKKGLVSFLLTLLVLGSFRVISIAQVKSLTPTGEFRMAVATFEAEILDPVAGSNDCKWYQTLMFDSLAWIPMKDGKPNGFSIQQG
jgi:hypothetical protein